MIEQDEFHKDFFIKKQYFISHQTDDIYKYFDFEPEPLGEGSYGVVYKATEKSTKEVRAIKQINLRDIKGGRKEPLTALNESEIAEESKGLYNNFLNELASLKLLDHPNIIKLYEVYEWENAIYLVQEFCDGGELFDYIVEQGALDETVASDLFQQMVGAVIYCHKNRICHRDLKPENFMLCSHGDGWKVKLIDFGISRSYFRMDESMGVMRMSSIAGTTPYMAPEVFRRNYSNSCDTWSLGVILYIMVAGYPPFEGYEEDDIETKIKNLDFSFDDEIWVTIDYNI